MDQSTIQTAVLIIGGGAAGLRAAVESARRGANTLLVSKTAVGKASATTLAGGNFSAALGGVTSETHLTNTRHDGRNLNDMKLLRVMVDRAPELLMELSRACEKTAVGKGNLRFFGPMRAWGIPITATLTKMATQAGATLRSHILILDLVIRNGHIAGVLACHWKTGELFAIEAQAVVLATGGGGAAYLRTDNPTRMVGDGYALAARAGAPLRDMEFVQFYPLGMAEPGHKGYMLPPPLADHGRLLNRKGEDILVKHGITVRPVAVRCRDQLSIAMFKESLMGNAVNGAIQLDLREVTDEQWNSNVVSQSMRGYLESRYHCHQRPILTFPTCHFWMGGVAIDETGATAVPGLFAAGEVTGGLHGANRMGGNALTETIVFGAMAGASAAAYSSSASRLPFESMAMETRRQWLNELRSRPFSINATPSHIRTEVGRILWNHVGIIRTGEGLRYALKELERLRCEALPRMAICRPYEIMEAAEAENIIDAAVMVAMAALHREESRGAHYRVDFPTTNDQRWLCSVFLKRKNETLTVEEKPLTP